MHKNAAVRERITRRLGDPVQWTQIIQVAKTVVAAVAAWVIAASMFGLPQPFLAPWAALLVVHSTVYRSFWTGAKQVAATVLGVLLAWVTGHTLGLDPVALGLGANPWGSASGAFLSGLMRRMDTPIASRWAHIALRNALFARARSPRMVHPVDWTAERAEFLVDGEPTVGDPAAEAKVKKAASDAGIPVLLVGDGGIYLEALKDFRLLLPPFTEAQVVEKLGQLRIAPLLAGSCFDGPADAEGIPLDEGVYIRSMASRIQAKRSLNSGHSPS